MLFKLYKIAANHERRLRTVEEKLSEIDKNITELAQGLNQRLSAIESKLNMGNNGAPNIQSDNNAKRKDEWKKVCISKKIDGYSLSKLNSS